MSAANRTRCCHKSRKNDDSDDDNGLIEEDEDLATTRKFLLTSRPDACTCQTGGGMIVQDGGTSNSSSSRSVGYQLHVLLGRPSVHQRFNTLYTQSLDDHTHSAHPTLRVHSTHITGAHTRTALTVIHAKLSTGASDWRGTPCTDGRMGPLERLKVPCRTSALLPRRTSDSRRFALPPAAIIAQDIFVLSMYSTLQSLAATLQTARPKYAIDGLHHTKPTNDVERRYRGNHQ